MKVLTPLKAMRAKCLDCCCGSAKEVQLCPCTDCSLYPYRLGRSPTIKKRELTEEQRDVLRERMRRINDAKHGKPVE